MTFTAGPSASTSSPFSLHDNMLRAMKTLWWLLVAALIVLPGGRAQQRAWPQIKDGSTANRYLGISGMALWQNDGETTAFIIAHDAKTEDGDVPRIGILTVSPNAPPRYVKLAWPKDHALSNDLEAISAIPDHRNEFVALTSWGSLYHLTVTSIFNAPALRIVKENVKVSKFPTGGNIEGFALHKFGDRLFAVWADRGNGSRIAELLADTFDPDTDAFGQHPVSLGHVQVDYPAGDCVRHVSDLKIDTSGRVFVSSARDCDDKNAGPFMSAAYRIGGLTLDKNGLKLVQLKQPELIFKSDLYKIEALEFMPRTERRFIFGTDDELDGGAFYVQP